MRRAAYSEQPTTIGLIGFGRIGRRLAERLAGNTAGPKLITVLVRPDQESKTETALGQAQVCTSLDAFIANRPEVAVECASSHALIRYLEPILAAGIDLIPLSLAALADKDVEAHVMGAADRGPGRLEIPAGAMGSLDILAAAREDTLSHVRFLAAYPVERWRGTAAETIINLDAIADRTTFYRGSVRDIARLFPRHVNVGVGVGLAGLGLDRTDAELIADPNSSQAEFGVDIAAGPGAVVLRVFGRQAPLGADPADYTAFSILRLLRRRQANVMI